MLAPPLVTEIYNVKSTMRFSTLLLLVFAVRDGLLKKISHGIWIFELMRVRTSGRPHPQRTVHDFTPGSTRRPSLNMPRDPFIILLLFLLRATL